MKLITKKEIKKKNNIKFLLLKKKKKKKKTIFIVFVLLRYSVTLRFQVSINRSNRIPLDTYSHSHSIESLRIRSFLK